MCFPQPPAYRRRCPLPTRQRPPSIPCNGARGRLLGHRRVEDERRLQTEERNCTHRVQSSGCMLSKWTYLLVDNFGEVKADVAVDVGRGARGVGAQRAWALPNLAAPCPSMMRAEHDQLQAPHIFS